MWRTMRLLPDGRPIILRRYGDPDKDEEPIVYGRGKESEESSYYDCELKDRAWREGFLCHSGSSGLQWCYKEEFERRTS